MKTKDDLLQVTPNLMGFQFVMFGIASRMMKKKKQPSKITIDHQAEFNKAQRTLQDFYSKMPDNYTWQLGPGLPEISTKGMPVVPIVFSSSRESAGLQLTDIFLWIFKRQGEGKKLPPELLPILRSQVYRGNTDELSLSAISEKWSRWFQERSSVSVEDMKLAREGLDICERK